MEIYQDDLQILLTDLELMVTTETDPGMNELRFELITQLKLHVNELELTPNPQPGSAD